MAALMATTILLGAWAYAVHESAYAAPQLWKNAYWPFTVELKVVDR